MKLHIRWITLVSSLLLFGLSIGCSPSGSEQADDEAPVEQEETQVEEAEEAAPVELNQETCEEACTKIVACDPDIDEDFHQPCVDGCMKEGKVEEVTCFIESSCEKILEDACGI